MTVRDSLKELIEKKLHKFDKFFDEDTQAYVTCRTRKGVKIIEITVTYGGTLFRSEEESDTFATALDHAMESFERQIRKNKTRLDKKLHSEVLDDFFEPLEEDEDFDIIREKTISLKPQSVEEAILQMNLLGHKFYMFLNADTDEINVVYKRNATGYGVIAPDNYK